MTKQTVMMVIGLLMVGGCTMELEPGEDALRADQQTQALELPELEPQLIPANYHGLDMGGLHGCVVNDCEQIVCWGRDDYDQASPPRYGRWTAVTAGGLHTCALSRDGSIRCWGNNSFHQLDAPTGTGYLDIEAGPTHTCAIEANGTPVCWGRIAASPPPQMARATTGIASGNGFSCGEYDDRTSGLKLIGCWAGGSVAPSTSWFAGSPPHDTDAGLWHACTLRGNQLLCWGDNTYHQIDGFGIFSDEDGNPTAFASADPEDPANTHLFPRTNSGYGWTRIATGYYHTCGINDRLRTDTGHHSNVFCFGSDGAGEVSGVPALDFREVNLGGGVSCGITTGGDVACWGTNQYGVASPSLPTECALSTVGIPDYSL